MYTRLPTGVGPIAKDWLFGLQRIQQDLPLLDGNQVNYGCSSNGKGGNNSKTSRSWHQNGKKHGFWCLFCDFLILQAFETILLTFPYEAGCTVPLQSEFVARQVVELPHPANLISQSLAQGAVLLENLDLWPARCRCSWGMLELGLQSLNSIGLLFTWRIHTGPFC